MLPVPTRRSNCGCTSSRIGNPCNNYAMDGYRRRRNPSGTLQFTAASWLMGASAVMMALGFSKPISTVFLNDSKRKGRLSARKMTAIGSSVVWLGAMAWYYIQRRKADGASTTPPIPPVG